MLSIFDFTKDDSSLMLKMASISVLSNTLIKMVSITLNSLPTGNFGINLLHYPTMIRVVAYLLLLLLTLFVFVLCVCVCVYMDI